MVAYVLVTAVASELFSFVGGAVGATVFKKSNKTKQLVAAASPVADEEKGADAGGTSRTSSGQTETGGDKQETLQGLSRSESIFTFSNVEYSVPYQGGQRRLLNKVSGYAKPGVMIALIGASGAGKSSIFPFYLPLLEGAVTL